MGTSYARHLDTLHDLLDHKRDDRAPTQRRSMKTLKPMLGTLPTALRAYRSGDDRIRGSALQRIRDRILTRDCGVCQCERCKATGDVREATIVDHVVPLWAGGREDDSNRQAINAECHDRKSADEARQRAGSGNQG